MICLFVFMLKLLQYCNYIIIVMQIKLMLLLLLLCSEVFVQHTGIYSGVNFSVAGNFFWRIAEKNAKI